MSIELIFDQDASLLDIRRPLLLFGSAVSFGFEVEFSPDARDIVFEETIQHMRVVKQFLYPFLDGTSIQESTGNLEVRSSPYTGENAVLAKVIRDMHMMKTALGTNMRSFHLHMRFPLISVPENRKLEFKCWVSRLADTVLFWRLQNRKHNFALNYWSQKRRNVSEIHKRGTVRLDEGIRAPGFYDLELRGFMNCDFKIQQLTQIIVTMIARQCYHGYVEFQTMSTDISRQMSLIQFFQKYKTEGCRVLGDREKSLLERLQKSATKHSAGNVILFGIGVAPYLNDREKAKILAANRKFVQDFNQYFTNVLDLGKYPTDAQMFQQYRWRLKLWAREIDLHRLLLNSLCK